MVPNVPGRGELRSNFYVGFLVFKRQFCGGQFLADLLEGLIKLEIFDSGKYYAIDSSIMVENGRQTSAIVQVFLKILKSSPKSQFHLTNTAQNNLPRKSGKNRNYDLFYLYVSGHQSYKKGTAEVKCLESLNVGILLDETGYFQADNELTGMLIFLKLCSPLLANLISNINRLHKLCCC